MSSRNAPRRTVSFPSPAPISRANARASAATPRPESAQPSAAGTARRAYDRARDLPRLIALWPHEIDAASPAAHARLLAKLRKALRGERQRGLAGHWAYDLARHAQLLRAYRAEVALSLSTRAPTSAAPREGA